VKGIQLLGRDAILEGAVGNFAGIPNHGPARVDDQEAGRDHIHGGHFVRLQAVGIGVGGSDFAAVENIETQRLRGLRPLRLLNVGRMKPKAMDTAATSMTKTIRIDMASSRTTRFF